MSLIYDVSFDSTTRVLSLLDKEGNVISSCEVPSKEVDDITKPLTFKATQDGSTVKLTKTGSPSGDFRTSRDGGNTWTNYTIGTAITLNAGEEVSFRAKADRTTAQNANSYFSFVMTGKIEAWHNVMSLYRPDDFATYNTVVSYAFYWLFKDCTSLTKAPELPATTLASSCYQSMFSGCISLTKAPELPATTLAQYCYAYMFSGCTALAEAPTLPATTLSDICYWCMFRGCTSLTKAPELPSTTLASSCYNSMFRDCTSLTKAPELPATTLDTDCYRGMFSGCTSLTKAPALPATTLAQQCYYQMFSGCTSLTKAPALPATSLAGSCYQYMFKGCTSLTKAPELPSTTLSEYCYQYMFNGCSSLNEVHCKIPPTYSSSQISSYTSNWLYNVSPTGTFYTNADANWPSGASGVPTGWTRVNESAPTVDDITKPLTFKATQDGSTVKLTKTGSPSGDFQTSTDGGNTWTNYTIDNVITLNTGDEVSFRAKNDRSSQNGYDYFYFKMTGKIEAWNNVMSLYRTNDFATYNTMVQYAFNHLFKDCTSLTKAPVLPATTLERACYYWMFSGCTSLSEAPELPATTLAYQCYSNMFRDCTSLTKAPELPATTLADGCYLALFIGCTSLLKAPELPATTLEYQCYRGMFQNCTSLTEAPELPATILDTDCYGYMFYGCTSLVNAPALPATKLASDCYQYMFNGCSSLNEVHCKMSSSYSSSQISSYTKDWLSNVSSTGTFYTNADANWPSGSVSGIPEGWTRVNT